MLQQCHWMRDPGRQILAPPTLLLIDNQGAFFLASIAQLRLVVVLTDVHPLPDPELVSALTARGEHSVDAPNTARAKVPPRTDFSFISFDLSQVTFLSF